MLQTESVGSDDRMEKLLTRLCSQSDDAHLHVYRRFDWPSELPRDQRWMGPELTTLYGTEIFDTLTEEQVIRLTQEESLNFYSLNVHGIRELLIGVVMHIHSPGFEGVSEFLHRFVGEENEHMWFFATFCRKYGRIYPDRSVKFGGGDPADDELSRHFITFSKIVLFEELVDYFNVAMSKDEGLHPVIREVNRVHHADETRHLAFGRQILAALFSRIKAEASVEKVNAIRAYIVAYMKSCLNKLYHPDTYLAAGIPGNAFGYARQAFRHEGRREMHLAIMRKSIDALLKNNILEEVPAL